jgi:hypothetical protein
MIPASFSSASGVWLGTLSTIGHPAAIAGASLCAARLSGRLNGLMAATGPAGKRLVMPVLPREAGFSPRSMTSPETRSASSPAIRNVSAVRSTSVLASLIGLPASSESSRASSSFRSVIACAIPRSNAERSYGAWAASDPWLATAASIARSSCSAVASKLAPTRRSPPGVRISIR